jgi:hypothetical protein
MTDQLLNIFREYLLIFDEEKKEQIKKDLSENDSEIISGIERAFLTDTHIDKIIKDFSLTQFQYEIRDLHAEFYLELAELYAEGKINKIIKTLLSSDNITFKKTITLFPNETAFSKELSIAVDDAQTEKLIKGYAQIDEWLESKKTNLEIAAEVIPIRKMIFKYAIAAATVGLIFGGSYLLIFNPKIDRKYSQASKDSIIKTNQSIPKVGLPNIIEKRLEQKTVLLGKASSAFALTKNSITIEVNGLSNQIDTLQNIFENLQNKDKKQADTIQYQVIKKIDSLQALLNTYTFKSNTKEAILNLPIVAAIKNIISINPNNLSKLYINIQGQYYLIENNAKPVKLIPVLNSSLLDSLKTIEFLNE